MKLNAVARVLDGLILALVLVLANLRALMFIFLFPDTSVFWGPAWIEILLWLLVTAGFTYLLLRDGLAETYLALWRRNWLVALFLVLALISVAWSIGPIVTLFRALELLCATLIGAYLGLRFGSEQLLEFLFWFGAGLFILSIALVYGAPNTGTMYWQPFNGAWRGVYWHRNHLASIASLLSAVYFMRAWAGLQARNNKVLLDIIFYGLALWILYQARSATGYILFIVLHAFLFAVLVWLKISHHLKRWHYGIAFGVMVLGAVVILSNLDVVFGVFNRDATMTGRVGLWSHLLDLASRRPWLGHGFGAVWTFESFRQQIQSLAGWPSQPLIADNGFLDIYLHLGVIGLLVFLGAFLLMVVRSIRYAVTRKTLTAFLPLLVMVYALFANLSFSLFAETEVFVWLLMVTVLFTSTSPDTALS